jgi:hypothetical protein
VIVPLVHTNVRRVQQVALALFPHGGQGHARRNAWAGMVSDASVSRNRREADAAMLLAADRYRRAARAL